MENINVIKGCTNNCKYCYAKNMAKRFGRCTEDTWKNMEIRWDVVNKSYKKFTTLPDYRFNTDLAI